MRRAYYFANSGTYFIHEIFEILALELWNFCFMSSNLVLTFRIYVEYVTAARHFLFVSSTHFLK